MKKQIILLIVCIALAAGLGGALYFLLGYEPEGEEEPSSGSTSVLIVEKEEFEVDTVRLENSAGETVIKNLGEKQYSVDGLDGAPLNQTKLSAAARLASDLAASDVVTDNPENLADFGLEPPKGTLTATYTDGSTLTLQIGNEAPAGNGTYVKRGDEPTVYTVSQYTAANALLGQLDFIDLTIMKSPSQNEQQPILPGTVTIGGSGYAEPIIFQQGVSDESMQAISMSSYIITSPKKRSVDNNKPTEAITGLMSITADKAIAYLPNDQQLEQYGLKTPYMTIDMLYNDTEGKTNLLAVKISEKDADGNLYVMKDGIPVVYQLAADKLPIYGMQYGDFLSTLQLLPFIDDVGKITLTAPGKEWVYALEGEGEELKVTCNGQEINVDDFRDFYQGIIGLPAEEYTSDPAPEESSAVLSAQFDYRDSTRESDRLALLPSSNDRKVFLAINGDAEFYAKASYVETILKNADSLLAGGTISPLY